MTRRTTASKKSIADPVFVLHNRPLRPGYQLEETSRFRDDVWILTPALIQRHQQALQLNFRSIAEPTDFLPRRSSIQSCPGSSLREKTGWECRRSDQRRLRYEGF